MLHIELGTKLLLKPLNQATSESELEFVSHFKSELPDNHILIETPIHKGEPYPLSFKEPMRASFIYKDGVCNFLCVGVERLSEEGVHYIRARIISKISHTQRRNYFRVKKAIRGELTIWKSTNDNETHEVHSECLSYDISCGGIALYTKESCEVGENIIVSIPIGPEDEVVHLYSEVRWRRNVEVDSYNFLMGIWFCCLNDSEKETVRRYVHQLQLNLIQKVRNKK